MTNEERLKCVAKLIPLTYPNSVGFVQCPLEGLKVMERPFGMQWFSY